MKNKQLRVKKTAAKCADKYLLYEKSVQSPKAEIAFVRDTFKNLRDRVPTVLREDFCGSAKISLAWIASSRTHVAFAVDIDPTVLLWCKEKKIARLSAGAKQRIHLLEQDVCEASPRPVDLVLAMNFSYWVMKTRAAMKHYFQSVYENLRDDGLLFLDAYGGCDALCELTEKTPHRHFTYLWQQKHYDPITGGMLCHIHFKFKDGSKLRRAFTYDWRFWTLPELIDLLDECGFKTRIYWEETDPKTGDGNGVFTESSTAEADACWIAYLVAAKLPREER